MDSLLPDLVGKLRNEPNVVLEAPPGAGKTTRVPPALLDVVKGEVWVLEPRRLAARLAARRVASEMGEPPGVTVGYQVRFEQVGGRQTRLRYLTEGVLTRRFLSDPDLSAASAVVLDEFHERHLDTDLALALLKNLQARRPDLRLVVMSATLDAKPIAAWLGDCAVLRSEGRLHPMQIAYRPHSAAPLEEQVRDAVVSLIGEGLTGDILVFLPGAAEIQRATRALEDTARRTGLLIAPLHGDLSPEEQDRAVAPAHARKVILSTNVAESSVTIEGVTVVIDSGLARLSSHSPWSGLPVLTTGRVSKASAIQRAGRSARTAPGRVIRLYPEEDFLRRPDHHQPELLREDLSSTALTLKSMGFSGFDGLDWFEPPPTAAVDAAEALLTRLEAVDSSGRLTATGRAMAVCPVEPRLARLAIEAVRRNVGAAGAWAAALLSLGARLPRESRHATPSDVLALMEAPDAPRQARRLADSLRSALRIPAQSHHDDDALRLAILAAFPDRVARRRNKDELLLAGGGSALLASSSTVKDKPFLAAIDIEERPERGLPLVRLASAIEPEWLLDLFPDRIEERAGVDWNRAAERVESVSALLYDGLVIEESRSGAVDPALAGSLLTEKAREAGLERFLDVDQLTAFQSRVAFAAAHSNIRPLTDDDIWKAVEELAYGLRGFRELDATLRGTGLERHLESKLDRRLLEEIAPARLTLASGRTAKIEYAENQPPRVGAKLQEFFGLHDTPRIARGKVPLVLLLLAPSQRPVQTTSDLKGFWQKWYPEIRKELMRRYPKHSWPEHPG